MAKNLDVPRNIITLSNNSVRGIAESSSTSGTNTNKNPWMINSLAVVAGETMFLDEEYIDKTRSLILSEKTRCRQMIEESHKFKLYPSYRNFYLLKILDEGVDAHMLFERAKGMA